MSTLTPYKYRRRAKLGSPRRDRSMRAEALVALRDAAEFDVIRPSPQAGWRQLDEIAEGIMGGDWRHIALASVGTRAMVLAEYLRVLAGLTADGVLEHTINGNGWEWWRVRQGFEAKA